MEIDNERVLGFYWVRFRGALTIGRYDLYADSCVWTFAGIDSWFVDDEVEEILAGPLEAPGA